MKPNVIRFCHQYRAMPARPSMPSDHARGWEYQSLTLISSTLIMDSSKNGMLNENPVKKFRKKNWHGSYLL